MNNKKNFVRAGYLFVVVIGLAQIMNNLRGWQAFHSLSDCRHAFFAAYKPLEYARNVLQPHRPIMKGFFSRDEKINVQQLLAGLIEAERNGIDIESFRFTSQVLADTLKMLPKAVKVRIVADRGCIQSPYSKLHQLSQRSNIQIRLYPPIQPREDEQGNRKHVPLMHNKIMIFKNCFGKSIVSTGSYNFTKSAADLNEENIIIFDDRDTVSRYKEHFEKLFNASEPYHKDVQMNEEICSINFKPAKAVLWLAHQGI